MSLLDAPESLSSREVAREAGISYRQIDYWIRAGVLGGLEESRERGWLRGSGSRRRFTPADARVVRILAQVARVRGTSTAQLRRVAERLRGNPSGRWLILGDRLERIVSDESELADAAEAPIVVVPLWNA